MNIRYDLLDQASELYGKLCNMGHSDLADQIMNDNGASPDDSDPDEGFFITMSNDQVYRAIDKLRSEIEYIKATSMDTYEVELSGKEFRVLMSSLKAAKKQDSNNAAIIDSIMQKFI